MVHPDSSFPIIIKPYILNTTLLKLNPSNELEFEISNVSESEVVLSKIFVPVHYYSVSLPDKIEAGETLKGSIKLTENGKSSKFENSFTILTDIGRKYRFTIPVVRAD